MQFFAEAAVPGVILIPFIKFIFPFSNSFFSSQWSRNSNKVCYQCKAPHHICLSHSYTKPVIFTYFHYPATVGHRIRYSISYLSVPVSTVTFKMRCYITPYPWKEGLRLQIRIDCTGGVWEHSVTFFFSKLKLPSPHLWYAFISKPPTQWLIDTFSPILGISLDTSYDSADVLFTSVIKGSVRWSRTPIRICQCQSE